MDASEVVKESAEDGRDRRLREMATGEHALDAVRGLAAAVRTTIGPCPGAHALLNVVREWLGEADAVLSPMLWDGYVLVRELDREAIECLKELFRESMSWDDRSARFAVEVLATRVEEAMRHADYLLNLPSAGL